MADLQIATVQSTSPLMVKVKPSDTSESADNPNGVAVVAGDDYLVLRRVDSSAPVLIGAA